MKDSRMDWIGIMPEDWECRTVKSLFGIKKEIAGELGHTVLSVTQNGIRKKDIESNEGQQSNDYTKYQIVKQNDFIMNHMDLLTGYVDISSYDGVTSPDYRVFTSKGEIHPKYALYIFQNAYKNKIFYGLGQGVSALGRWRLPRENFLKFMIPFPPVTEQRIIAEYLDSECARIDRLSELSVEKIQKLQELKQSIIDEKVTRGLNPDIRMRNTRVKWIQEIPNTWEIRPLKRTFEMRKGLGITKSDLQESGLPVISYGQIHAKYNSGTRIDDELIRYVDSESEKINPQSLTSVGDLIVADTSEDLEGCGNCVYVDRDGIYAGYHTILLHNIQCESTKYFAYLFKTDVWRAQLRAIVEAVKVYSITQSKLGQISIIQPPLEEQIAISQYLDSECARIERLIELEIQIIRKLTEFKQSLIYECITGKKEAFQ